MVLKFKEVAEIEKENTEPRMNSGTSTLQGRKQKKELRVKNSDLKPQKEPGKCYFVAATVRRLCHERVL